MVKGSEGVGSKKYGFYSLGPWNKNILAKNSLSLFVSFFVPLKWLVTSLESLRFSVCVCVCVCVCMCVCIKDTFCLFFVSCVFCCPEWWAARDPRNDHYGDDYGSVLYLAQSLIQIEADSKSTRKGDLECFPLCKSADSFPHHIRGCITVKVPIVTKGIRLCANGPFWTLFSLIQHHFMAKAARTIDIDLFIYLAT